MRCEQGEQGRRLTQAVKPLLSATIRSIHSTSIASVVRKYRLNGYMIANTELADSWPNHIDDSGYLMSHRYWWRSPSECVWRFWYQRCSSGIFVDVCGRVRVRFAVSGKSRTAHLYRKCQRRLVECGHVHVRHQEWEYLPIVRLPCHETVRLSS